MRPSGAGGDAARGCGGAIRRHVAHIPIPLPRLLPSAPSLLLTPLNLPAEGKESDDVGMAKKNPIR